MKQLLLTLVSKPVFLLIVLYGCMIDLPAQAQSVESIPIFDRQSSITTGATILKPGDEIHLSVLGFPDLSGNQVILANGTIQLPLVGSVPIARMTPNQVVTYLTDAFTPYIRRPQVGLTLIEIRPPQVSVTGAVHHPGSHLLEELRGSDDDDNTANVGFHTLSHALVVAGGITPDADIRNIIVRRQPLATPGTYPLRANADWMEIRVDLWTLIQGGDLSKDLHLLDNDEIIVPTASISRVDQELLLSSTLAPATISVQVAGEVLRPGQLQIASDADISDVVAAAGGLTDDAREDNIVLFRMSPDGQLNRDVFVFGETSAPLSDGDVVVVEARRRRGIRNAFDFLGTILNPIGAVFSVFD
ncbi:MAG: SLBB domain-containing protein [Leptolyngbyaceae cyanobacterium]